MSLLDSIVSRGKRTAKAPPVVTEGLPLVGPATAFKNDPLGFLQRARAKYGDVFTVDLLVYKSTFIAGAAAQKRFFAQPSEVLDLNEAVDEMMVPVLGPRESYKRLTAHTAQVMEIIRRGLMKHDRLDAYLSVIERVADDSVERWVRAGEIDLFRECSRLVNHANVATLIGEDARAEFADRITDIVYALETDGIAPEVVTFPWLPTPAQRRCIAARTQMQAILGEMIARRTKQRGDDYISLWLDEPFEGGPVTAPEFTGHLIAVFFAAHTNTTATLGWSLAEFARNPKSLARVRDEVAAFARDNPGESRFADLKALPFVESCMREAVRMHFAILLMRRAMQDYEEGGYVIPKGHVVCISPLLTHLDPSVYPNPETFDAERFADVAKARKLEREGAFVQFGLGEHRCLGEMFAFAVIKTAIRSIVERVDLNLVDERLPKPDYTKTLGSAFPSGPIRMKVTKRERRTNG